MISKGHYAVIQFPLPIFQILRLRNEHNSMRLKVRRSIVPDAGAQKMRLPTTYQEVSASGSKRTKHQRLNPHHESVTTDC